MTAKTYLTYIMVVYEQKDPLGNFTNSTQVELFDTDRESAEKRALEIAGTKSRPHVHTKMVIERFRDNASS